MGLIGFAAALSMTTGPMATSAAAQGMVPVQRRVDTLEKQMRSVQRRVFKPGSAAALEAGFIINNPTPERIRLAPPLVLTEAQADSFLSAWPGLLDTAYGGST